MNVYIRNILRFCVLVLLQVLILNKIVLRWWAEPTGFPVFVPYIYPLFLFLLPFETPVWAMLFCGFALGISVDAFTNTAGMHAFATVLIAYLRTNVLTALLPRNLSEYSGMQPSTRNMGWSPFLVYTGFLLLLHHLVFFSIELWNLTNLGHLLLKTFASTVTSLLFVIAYLLLFTRQDNSRV